MPIRLETELRHRQLAVPQLLESLSLLAMNAAALDAYVQDVLLSNPVLEYGSAADADAHDRFLESIPVREGGLVASLLFELHTLAGISRRVEAVAEYLIANLRDDGYLADPLSSLSVDSGFSKALLQEALAVVQQLEPAGVGARNLRECLLLQLLREAESDACAMEIVRHHLAEVPRGILALPGYSQAQIADAIAHIKRLDPRPGLRIADASPPEAAIPELEILVGAEGKLEVRLIHQPAIPVISPLYASQYRSSRDAETASYVRVHASNARLLLYALQKRSEMLLRVGQCIAEQQADYFLRGGALQPLTMERIAAALSCNRSTVCRAVRGKYLSFGGATYSIAAFLPSQVRSGHSSALVKARLAALIRQHADSPVSDQRLSELLAEEGILAARRTVNKYRNEMRYR